MNHFKIDNYKQDIDPVEHYVEQASIYLHKLTGDDIHTCEYWVRNKLKDGTFKDIKNPNIVINRRDPASGDTHEENTTLLKYIKVCVDSEIIIAPTFTTYLQPTTKPSLVSKFIGTTLSRRKIAKKKAFTYLANNDINNFNISNTAQINYKLNGNSVTGSFCVKTSVLFNPTAHSSLTSTVRTLTSLSNGSMERFISGNRYYHHPSSVITNITSILSTLDKSAFKLVMDKYGLKYLTQSDAMLCIKRSRNLYLQETKYDNDIVNFINKLDYIELSAIVYIGDLYHIREHNDEFIKSFLDTLSKKVIGKLKTPMNYIKCINEDVMMLAHQICTDDIRGMGKDYEKMDMVGVLSTLVLTANNIEDTLCAYDDFIKVFFLTQNLPPDVAYVPNMMRRSVVVSDTDSTCAALDKWVEWRFGSVLYTESAIAISASIMFLSTQILGHVFATFVANLGVKKDNFFTMKMKSEFFMNVFSKVDTAKKHYYSVISIKEGNVLPKPKLDIKGLNLKSSKTPEAIRKKATHMMDTICYTIMNGGKISLMEQIIYVANIEREIKKSLLNNEMTYHTLGEVKSSELYANTPDKSPYVWYIFWVDVMQTKYDFTPELPFTVIQLPTTLHNKTNVVNWLNTMVDVSMAVRIKRWMTKYGKKELPNIYLPTTFIQNNGIPDEFSTILNITPIINKLCGMLYMVLTTIGFTKKEHHLLCELGY